MKSAFIRLCGYMTRCFFSCFDTPTNLLGNQTLKSIHCQICSRKTATVLCDRCSQRIAVLTANGYTHKAAVAHLKSFATTPRNQTITQNLDAIRNAFDDLTR